MINVDDRKREAELFEKIALGHWNYIFNSAFKLSRNFSMAEDLTQETFLTGLEKFSQLRDHRKIKTWLYRIMRNQFLSSIEKVKNRRYYNYEDLSWMLEDVTLTEKRIQNEGFSDDLMHQLDRLDEKYRTPLLMSAMDDYSYKEISSALDIPVGTVMSRISRGKAFMRDNVNRLGSSLKEYRFGQMEEMGQVA